MEKLSINSIYPYKFIIDLGYKKEGYLVQAHIIVLQDNNNQEYNYDHLYIK
jgi:hypothetical protein